MTPVLFVLDPRAFGLIYGPEVTAALAGRAEILGPPLTQETWPAHRDLLRKTEVIFSGWGAPVMDDAFLEAAPKLRAVFYGAGTVRYFATDALWERGVVLSGAAAINAIPVSEYALATILFSLKRGWHHLSLAKRGREAFLRGSVPGAYGSKVGLVSLGAIGRLVRERLRPFDLEILAYDPFVTTEQAGRLGVRLVTLEELFAECDVVSLHTPLLKETEGLINGALLKAMKAGATLINTSRGAVLNEPELIDVLTRRCDLTAVLDVTCPEPPVAGSPLYTLPNVVLTPHIAGSLNQECRRMGQAMLDEFGRWQRGEPLKYRVEREQVTLMA